MTYRKREYSFLVSIKKKMLLGALTFHSQTKGGCLLPIKKRPIRVQIYDVKVCGIHMYGNI